MDLFDGTRREINSSGVFGHRFVQDGCPRRGAGTKRSWLRCDLLSAIRESVLPFPGIQTLCCTGPPALGDKWQNSTFHPSPSSHLSAVHGHQASVGGEDVIWAQKQEVGRSDAACVCVRVILPGGDAASEPPADTLQSANITGSCRIGSVS